MTVSPSEKPSDNLDAPRRKSTDSIGLAVQVGPRGAAAPRYSNVGSRGMGHWFDPSIAPQIRGTISDELVPLCLGRDSGGLGGSSRQVFERGA